MLLVSPLQRLGKHAHSQQRKATTTQPLQFHVKLIATPTQSLQFYVMQPASSASIAGFATCGMQRSPRWNASNFHFFTKT